MALPDATGEREHAIAVQGLGLAGLVHERWREGHVTERPRGVVVREAPTLLPEGSWGAEPVCHDLLVDGRINGNAGRILASPAVLTLYGAGEIRRRFEIDAGTVGADKRRQHEYGDYGSDQDGT